MAKQPKQTLLAVLQILLLSTSLPLIATNFDPVYPGTQQINSLALAQKNVKSNPQPTTKLVQNNTSQPTEQTTQDNLKTEEEEVESNLIQQENSKIIGFLIKTKTGRWLIFIFLLMCFYLIVFIFRPLWLLALPKELKIPQTPVNPEIKLFRNILRLSRYHPRVLDAWVKKYWATFHKKFLETSTINEGKDYVPLPVELNGIEIDELTEEALIKYCRREKRIRLLIWGEGRSGKTTIACQIAKWAMKKQEEYPALHQYLMLPVLINQEIDHTGDDIKPIMETIVAKTQELIDEEQIIADELLVEQLLRKRRILLIIDRYSEMSPETQAKINPDAKEFPANALIVVSRIEENLWGIDAKIKTLRFDGEKLVYFIKEYLKKQGKWHLFEADQEEFLRECAQIERIFGKQKTVTALLARFYAEKMINSKENNLTLEGSLDNIPDLMLNYLQKLNAKGEIETRGEYPTVTEDAQLIAWKCVEKNYRPSYTEREKVVEAFEGLGRNDGTLCIEYFEKHLKIVHSIGYGEIQDRNQIRFTVEPLAEYLAALYLVRENKD
ncbi:MAG: hypothetical protein MGF17_00770, partial [Trichodesmium sp. MAG_R04]|nr:hypothetical protein [Trichodesmium sp. MAG_R04]